MRPLSESRKAITTAPNEFQRVHDGRFNVVG